MLSQPNKSKTPRLHRLFAATTLLVGIAVLAVVVFKHQDVTDYLKLRNYDAPARIAQIADQTTMTDYGRKIFYVNKPKITSKQDFSKDCPNDGGEQTIVLGCYHGGQSGIFLLGVKDARLSGVVQVTAAHEMLHGAYDRLSTKDRQRIDKLLEDYYANELKDERILKIIDAYKKSEPNDVTNEMHSIFATEIADLPDVLDDYYAQYFDDRSKVIAYAAQYQNEFSSRQATIAQNDAELAVLKQQIDSLEAGLTAQLATINSRQASLESLRSSGNIPAYNAGVAPFNTLVDAYNRDTVQIQAIVTRYNDLVASRNAVALEEDQLVKELSSDAAPINN